MDDVPPNERIQRLFEGAVSLSMEDRKRFLDTNCNDEIERAEVEKLLKYDAIAGQGLLAAVTNRLPSTREISESRPGRGPRSSGSLIDHGQFVPGTVLSERYRIVGMLGKGGMGEVYRADDLELGQSVALKFLPKKLADDPRALERFRGEVRLARQVSHPNVCRVYDIGQIDNQWFLSMEYVDGEDLAQLLTRIGRFNAERATELARQLCLGLQAAHEKGVLHRDLKPANVMIDGRGKLLITDFGLAEINDQVRDEDIRAGTPAYMSPEQLAGREVTERSDIYSVGIILHELFTGKPVWQANSMAELLEQRKSRSVPDSSDSLSNLDPVVSRVIDRCLQPDPAMRPSSALSVAASLPGGDPLAAALAAGELPSPEVVAASGGTGGIRISTAVSLFAGILVALAVVAYMAKWRYSVNQAGVVKPPEVLVDNAREIIRENLGYQYEPEDSAFDFIGPTYGERTELLFWYRQRATANLQNFHFFNESEAPAWGRPTFQVPAWQTDEELGLITNSAGRLRFFRAIPPVGFAAKEAGENDPAWSQWFPPAVIGYELLDESDAEPHELEQEYPSLALCPDLHATTPDASDITRVWKGRDDGGEVTVVAAAFRGRPVYFEVLHEEDPGDSSTRFAMRLPGANRPQFAGMFRRGLINLMIIAAGVIAWFHLRSGRGDRTGAFRAALVVGGLFAFASLGIAHRLSPEKALFPLFGQTLVYAFLAWVFYIAIEPLVRRVWPQAPITWTRLIQGNWRDPVVSRSILAGVVACILFELHNSLGLYIALQFDPVFMEMSVAHRPLLLAGTPELFAMVATNVEHAIFDSFLILFLILGVRLAVRKEWMVFAFLAILLCTLVAAPLDVGIVPRLVMIYYVMVVIAVNMLVLVRFGLLALVAFYFTFQMLRNAPLTFDSQAWYYGHGMLFLALVCLVVLVTCYNAVGLRNIGSRSNSRVTQ